MAMAASAEPSKCRQPGPDGEMADLVAAGDDDRVGSRAFRRPSTDQHVHRTELPYRVICDMGDYTLLGLTKLFTSRPKLLPVKGCLGRVRV